MNTQAIEDLAAYAHSAWSGWMKYLFSLSQECTDGSEEIKPEQAKRWKRQMVTPYKELPESKKASDRDEARKMLAIMDQAIREARASAWSEGYSAGMSPRDFDNPYTTTRPQGQGD